MTIHKHLKDGRWVACHTCNPYLPEDVALKCFFCFEGTADAWWEGSAGTIFACRQCAIQSLPALIADAVVAAAPQGSPGIYLDRARTQMESVYWRSAALAKCSPATKECDNDQGRQLDESGAYRT